MDREGGQGCGWEWNNWTDKWIDGWIDISIYERRNLWMIEGGKGNGQTNKWVNKETGAQTNR